MIKRLIAFALLSAFLTTLWTWLSFGKIGWYAKVVSRFENERFLHWSILNSAKKEGLYLIPYPYTKDKYTPNVSVVYLFCSISNHGLNHSPIKRLTYTFCNHLVIAFCLGLFGTTIATYGRRLFGLFLFGLAGSMLIQLMEWTWWGILFSWIGISIVSHLITTLITASLMSYAAYKNR